AQQPDGDVVDAIEAQVLEDVQGHAFARARETADDHQAHRRGAAQWPALRAGLAGGAWITVMPSVSSRYSVSASPAARSSRCSVASRSFFTRSRSSSTSSGVAFSGTSRPKSRSTGLPSG